MDFSDRLLFFHEKLTDFFGEHLRTILGLIAVLIIIGLFWGGLTYYKVKKEREASLKLMEVVQSSDVIQALKDIKKKYKGTQADLEASLLLFNYYFSQKNYQKMQKLIKELEKDYPKRIKGVILYGKAKIFEIQRKFNKALETYKEISKIQPELNFLVYLDIARTAERLGKIDLAKEYYQKYLKEVNTENNGFAQYKLSQLNKK